MESAYSAADVSKDMEKLRTIIVCVIVCQRERGGGRTMVNRILSSVESNHFGIGLC